MIDLRFKVGIRHVDHPRLQTRRSKLRALGLCINGPMPGVDPKYQQRRDRVEHGPIVPGTTKCQGCHNVHNGLNRDGSERA